MYSFRQAAVLYLLLFVLLGLLVPRFGFDFDVDYWVKWSTYGFEHGLANIYEQPDISYNPFYQYILWLYGQMMGSVEKISHYRYFLKAFTLLFDFGGAIMVSRLGGRHRQFGLSLLLLFNVGYLYNTLVWSQVDAILATLVAGAILSALLGRSGLSLCLFVLALNTKPQGIIFLPPLLLLWLLSWNMRWQSGLLALLAGAALQLALVAPFVWWSNQNGLPKILSINLNAADYFPAVSMNAFNLWIIIQPESDWALISSLQDTTVGAAGLTYRQWGLLLFMMAAALALLPLLALVVRGWWNRRGLLRSEWALVLLSCAMLPLIFTYFNTQMHERYWHPAILLLAGYGFLTRRYGLFALVSGAYFLQLESVLQFLALRKYSVLLFDSYFIAGLFTLSILWGLLELYWWARRLEVWQVPERPRPVVAGTAVVPARLGS